MFATAINPSILLLSSKLLWLWHLGQAWIAHCLIAASAQFCYPDWGRPPLLQALLAPSADPHHTCALDTSPALLPFSIAPQCLSSSEGPKTDPRICVVASAVPSTWALSLSWSCWPCYGWYRPCVTGLLPTWACQAHFQPLSTKPPLFCLATFQLPSPQPVPGPNFWHCGISHNWPGHIDPTCPDPSVKLSCPSVEHDLHFLTQAGWA